MKRTKEVIEKEISELKEKLTCLETELQSLNNKVYIEWEGNCDRRQHGKPYLAILTKGENWNKYNYNFLPTVNEWHDKGRSVKSTYQGELAIGTILRGRHASSWKNDYQSFYMVTPEGLENIDETTVLQKLGILK